MQILYVRFRYIIVYKMEGVLSMYLVSSRVADSKDQVIGYLVEKYVCECKQIFNLDELNKINEENSDNICFLKGSLTNLEDLPKISINEYVVLKEIRISRLGFVNDDPNDVPVLEFDTGLQITIPLDKDSRKFIYCTTVLNGLEIPNPNRIPINKLSDYSPKEMVIHILKGLGIKKENFLISELENLDKFINELNYYFFNELPPFKPENMGLIINPKIGDKFIDEENFLWNVIEVGGNIVTIECEDLMASRQTDVLSLQNNYEKIKI